MPKRIRVLRVVARMNAGGPAYHVSLLSGRLDPERYETLLVAGEVGPREASFEGLAERYGARLEKISTLGPELRPIDDLRALRALVQIVRSFRPHIVHTHTAKAGLLGRLAACAIRPRPIIVHTYHGHVLEGYFGRAKTKIFRLLERGLATFTDRLIGVSRATVEDLVRIGIARREKFGVISVGLDLDAFEALTPEQGAAFRRTVGAEPSDVVVTYAGRLVPIKQLQMAIDAVAVARRRGAPVKLALVGDGECREFLEAHATATGLGDAITFTGHRDDLDAVIAGTDIAILSSDSEGTPVFLIEAAAGSRPAVATTVGGVPEVITPDTGLLVPRRDAEAMADAIAALARDPELRLHLGAQAAAHVRRSFGADRLVSDIGRLYEDLLQASPNVGREFRFDDG